MNELPHGNRSPAVIQDVCSEFAIRKYGRERPQSSQLDRFPVLRNGHVPVTLLEKRVSEDVLSLQIAVNKKDLLETIAIKVGQERQHPRLIRVCRVVVLDHHFGAKMKHLTEDPNLGSAVDNPLAKCVFRTVPDDQDGIPIILNVVTQMVQDSTRLTHSGC